MCLAFPGKLLTINHDGPLPMGEVEFSGVTKIVCLAYTPEAQIGDYVIVHVGFALSRVDEKEALSTIEMLREMGDLVDESKGTK